MSTNAGPQDPAHDPVTRDAEAPLLRFGAALDRQTPGPRQRWWHLVDPSVDSYKTRFAVSPDAVDLSVHRSNPVWLWGHGSARNSLGDPPSPENVIGRVLQYDLSPSGLDVLVEYDHDPNDPRALCNRVWDRVERGLLRACSVGAVPLKTGKDADGTTVYLRWSLREGSNVILPGNTRALVLERDAASAALDDLGSDPAAPPALGAQTPAPGASHAAPAATGAAQDAAHAPAPPSAGGGPVVAVQTTRDGAEPRRKEVASIAVFDGAGRLLFGKRRDNGLWTMPGGHLDPGEAPLDGARRELREESGYDLPAERFTYLGTGRPRGGDGQPSGYTIHAFRVGVTEADGQPSNAADPDAEVSEWRWLEKPRERNVTLALLGWASADGIDDLQPHGEWPAPAPPGAPAVPVAAQPAPAGAGGAPAATNGPPAARSADPAPQAVAAAQSAQAGAAPGPSAAAHVTVLPAPPKDSPAEVVVPIAVGTTTAAVPPELAPRPPTPGPVADRPESGARHGDGAGMGVADSSASAARDLPPSEGAQVLDLHTGGQLLATRGAVPHRRYETAEGPWDAAAEERAWRRVCSSDGSGDWDKVDKDRYAAMFCYVRGDGQHPSDYVLPHHGVRNGHLVTVWRGVVAAAAALQGARGGVSGMSAADRAAARAHLAEHYREFGRRAPWEDQEPGSAGERAASQRAGAALSSAVMAYLGGASVSDALAGAFGGGEDCGAAGGQERGASADPGDLAERGSCGEVDCGLSEATKAELRRGLEWHREGWAGAGLREATVNEARRLVAEGHWWPEKARRARAWFARHGAGEPARLREGTKDPTPHGVAWALWGGDPGRREVERVCAALDRAEREVAALAVRDLPPGAQGPALAAHARDLAHLAGADRGSGSHSGSEPHPGNGTHDPGSGAGTGADDDAGEPARAPAERDRATQPGAAYHPTRHTEPAGAQRTATTEKTMPHPMILPQHRELCREAIAHHLDGAEMHAQMRDALPADHVEHRALHRDMAMHSLKHADELHGHLRSMHGHEAPADGLVRTAPSFLKTKDEGADEATDELCREFRRVTAAVGRLPLTVGGLTREMLKVRDARGARVELSALRDNAAELVDLRRSQSDADARLALQRCDDLIARHSAPGPQCVITPAVEREMRGIDPATGQPSNLGRWSENEIRDYVAKRLPGGPVADITRQGALQPVNAAAAQPAAGGAQAPWAHPGTFAAPLLPATQQAPHFPGVTHIRSAPVDLVSQGPTAEQLPAAIRAYNSEFNAKGGAVGAGPQKVKDIYGNEVARQDANGVAVLREEDVLNVVRAQQEGALVFSDLTAETARGFRMAPLNSGAR